MIDRLVLWDIDGTLVRAGDIGAAVFDEAVADVLGRRPPGRPTMSGKTDPQIVGEYLAIMNEPDEEESVEAILLLLAQRLAESREVLAAEGHACPGAADVLERLAADDHVLSTALTGNIEPNAVVKLAAFGLDTWMDLSVGAYGSDDRDRRKLVPIARRRVQERYDTKIELNRTWVVGDTPRDLECARVGGVRCLLVATGRMPLSELAELGADVVLENLTDLDGVVAALTGN